MYKKAISLLLLGNLVFALGVFCVRGVEALQLTSKPVNALKLELANLEEKALALEGSAGTETYIISAGSGFASIRGIGIADTTGSGQRVVDYTVIEQEDVYELSDEDMEALLRIVEAEAGSEDEDGRLLVANVVLNRVNNDRFPSTVKDVVFQQSGGVSQFSPVASGRYYKVEISEETQAAVDRALRGEDISEGALFFASRRYADSSKMRWFDTKLTFLFEHGGHEFFKYKE